MSFVGGDRRYTRGNITLDALFCGCEPTGPPQRLSCDFTGDYYYTVIIGEDEVTGAYLHTSQIHRYVIPFEANATPYGRVDHTSPIDGEMKGSHLIHVSGGTVYHAALHVVVFGGKGGDAPKAVASRATTIVDDEDVAGFD